jgi:hypothetical protein
MPGAFLTGQSTNLAGIFRLHCQQHHSFAGFEIVSDRQGEIYLRGRLVRGGGVDPSCWKPCGLLPTGPVKFDSAPCVRRGTRWRRAAGTELPVSW